MPLAAARANLETRFEEMIQKCSDKVTELCKLEKQTWQTVDELNGKCEAMMNQVDTTVEKQVGRFLLLKFNVFLINKLVWVLFYIIMGQL